MQRKKKYKVQLLFGLLFTIGFVCFLIPAFQKQKTIQMERQKIDDFFRQPLQQEEDVVTLSNSKKEESYIAVVDIPKIHLKKGLFAIHHPSNHVDYNIMILKESDMPDIETGNFILAAHSGIGNVAYFRKMNQLEIGDDASIYYQGIEYVYQVINIYDVEKTGKVSIHRNFNQTTLTMITCKDGTNQQIVVVAELVEKNPYR